MTYWYLLWVTASCIVKVALYHTYVVLHMHRVVRHMHDVCTIHTGLNSAHGHPKLLVIKLLGLSVTVSIRARDSKWIFHSFFSILKATNTFVLPSWPVVWFDIH